MRKPLGWQTILATCALGVTGCAGALAQAGPPSVAGFADAVHHWQMNGDDDYPRHEEDDVGAIAENLLLMQRNNGGWVKNLDPLKVLTAKEQADFVAQKAIDSASFDNRNIYTQIEFLMAAYEILGDERYRHSAMRALDYLLDKQIEGCGGWPHTVPADTPYQDAITFNDDVFTGVLFLLRDIVQGGYPYASVEPVRRSGVAAALAEGEDCLLRLQIRQGDRLTVWAGQYDRVSLKPIKARSYELASLASAESVGVLRYLMSIPQPDARKITAIEAGVSWLRETAIEGVRVETFDLGSEVAYEYHKTRKDRRLVADPSAPLLWARYYDLADNSVMLANRDGNRVASYDDVLPERRSGYSWYGNWGIGLLEKDYPAWACRVKGEGC